MDHHGVEKDPTMDHRIVHSVCVSNKKEQVHLKNTERYLQNAFHVQQHIIRREEKDMLKNLQKLKMEKIMRHPEVRHHHHRSNASPSHSQRQIAHPSNHRLHANSNDILFNKPEHAHCDKQHHPEHYHPHNDHYHPHHEDYHNHHHYNGSRHHLHPHQHDHHSGSNHHFDSHGRHADLSRHSMLSHSNIHHTLSNNQQSGHHFPRIHHRRDSQQSHALYDLHHNHDGDYGIEHGHYSDSAQSIPGYMQPKRGDNHHHHHHHDEFVSLVESCISPRQPAGYGHSLKDLDKRRKSHLHKHNDSHGKKRRHTIDFDTAENYRPVGSIHLMSQLQPNYHDRLSNYTNTNPSYAHPSHNAVKHHDSLGVAKSDMNTSLKSWSISNELVPSGELNKKRSSRSMLSSTSKRELAHHGMAEKDIKSRPMPRPPKEPKKEGEVTRTLNITMKIKKGTSKGIAAENNHTRGEQKAIQGTTGRRSFDTQDLIIEDVSPPKSPEASSSQHLKLEKRSSQHKKPKVRRQISDQEGGTHKLHSSDTRMQGVPGHDLVAETIAELKALSASAAQSFAPSRGPHSRKSRFRQLAKELLMKKLPAIARQRQLAEFDPLEMLQCRYLRLSPTNVEELLDLCRQAGVTVDLHPHMTVEDITQQVFQKLDDPDAVK